MHSSSNCTKVIDTNLEMNIPVILNHKVVAQPLQTSDSNNHGKFNVKTRRNFGDFIKKFLLCQVYFLSFASVVAFYNVTSLSSDVFAKVIGTSLNNAILLFSIRNFGMVPGAYISGLVFHFVTGDKKISETWYKLTVHKVLALSHIIVGCILFIIPYIKIYALQVFFHLLMGFVYSFIPVGCYLGVALVGGKNKSNFNFALLVYYSGGMIIFPLIIRQLYAYLFDFERIVIVYSICGCVMLLPAIPFVIQNSPIREKEETPEISNNKEEKEEGVKLEEKKSWGKILFKRLNENRNSQDFSFWREVSNQVKKIKKEKVKEWMNKKIKETISGESFILLLTYMMAMFCDGMYVSFIGLLYTYLVGIGIEDSTALVIVSTFSICYFISRMFGFFFSRFSKPAINLIIGNIVCVCGLVCLSLFPGYLLIQWIVIGVMAVFIGPMLPDTLSFIPETFKEIKLTPIKISLVTFSHNIGESLITLLVTMMIGAGRLGYIIGLISLTLITLFLIVFILIFGKIHFSIKKKKENSNIVKEREPEQEQENGFIENKVIP